MTTSARFRAAYAEHRRAEGRGAGGLAELLSLPYLRAGPLARQWAVRARSFERFLRVIVAPAARAIAPRPLSVLDLGAGNGWLCYRLARAGHSPVALDWRWDNVDGLGAARGYDDQLRRPLARVAGSFDAIPLAQRFDIVVFNAAIHYSVSLAATLREAGRVTRPQGHVVILDSPFYRRAADGERMIAEKRATMMREWGPRATELVELPAIEYLTRERLEEASAGLGFAWRRHSVRHPVWFRMRPLVAALRRRRPPARFDLWEARVS
jgi:SAM-dependent methyltransferase